MNDKLLIQRVPLVGVEQISAVRISICRDNSGEIVFQRESNSARIVPSDIRTADIRTALQWGCNAYIRSTPIPVSQQI